MKLQTIITLLLIVFAAVFSVLIYNQLPAIVPSHWNAAGEIDGHMRRESHLIFFLALIVIMPLLITWLPKIDPKYSNIKKFEGDYSWFVVVMTGFMVGLFVYTTYIALGHNLPIQNFMIPALSVLFFSVGVLMEKVKSNYTIGIRIPWTLNSEKNWEMTHQVAAKAFKYGATLMILTLPLGVNAIFGLLVVILGIVVVPMAYSYSLHVKGI